MSYKEHQMLIRIKKINLIFFILLTVCTNKIVYAEGVSINSTNTYIDNNIFYLDASYKLNLTEESYKALRQGISFEIHIEFQLLEKRKWLWNKILFKKKLIYKLEHKPLTKNFLITNLNSGIVNYYKNLDAAVNAIGNISKLKLFDKNKLRNNIKYLARIRLYLDVDSLPSPLRPRAYFSSDWNISSQWYRWEI